MTRKTLRNLVVVNVAVGKLLPFANNAQEHTDDQVAELASSIKRFGFTNPVLATPDGVVIAGHGRILAAKLISMPVIPVIYIDGLSDSERRALTVLDNQLTKKADYKLDILSVELDELDKLGFDVEGLGFSKTDLDHLFETSGPNTLSDLEEPAPAKPADDGEKPLRLQIELPEDVMERYESLMHRAPGRQAWQKFDALLCSVDPTVLCNAGGKR